MACAGITLSQHVHAAAAGKIVFLQAVLPRNKLMSLKRVAIDFGGLIALWLLSGCKQVPESLGTEAGINDLIFKSSGLP